MNILSRDQQIQVIACLTEGMTIRATERITGIHRDTIMRFGAKVGRGCAELHDRMFVGIRTGRVELDELWAYVGKKQKHVDRPDHPEFGDQWTFVAMASSARAIIAYYTGKRDRRSTEIFIADVRERVLGAPEFSMDGFQAYRHEIANSFRQSSVGVITKTFHVTNLNRTAAHRYSPAEVIQVEREAFMGTPEQISTSYVERSHLTLRMSNKRFARLGNGFSKKLANHAASISLYVSFYNLCRVHESLRSTPAVAQGIADASGPLATC